MILNGTYTCSEIFYEVCVCLESASLLSSPSPSPPPPSFPNMYVQDVENVFTRHKPLLADLLDQLFKGKLKENVFPFTGSTKPVDRYLLHRASTY